MSKRTLKKLSAILLVALIISCGGCRNEQETTNAVDKSEDNETTVAVKEEKSENVATISPISSNENENAPDVSGSIYEDGITQKALCDNDFLLYYVNCGTLRADETGEGELLGLYQSVTDRELGKDSVTGREWGYYNTEYFENEYELADSDKLASKWVIKNGIEYDNQKTGIYYKFYLPRGEYEVICGFNNPFNARTVDITAEDVMQVSEFKILKYRCKEAAFTVSVEDGSLELFVGNGKRGTDRMKDPILSYIYVRAIPAYDSEALKCLVERYDELTASKAYSESSFAAYSEVYAEAAGLKSEDESEIKTVYTELKEAFNGLKEIEIYSSYTPGARWYDLEGEYIQAHGGQVQRIPVYDEETGSYVEKWWWVGEDKSLGYRGGIRAYSSDDLYNWRFEGVVMRNVSSREQLDTEEYFTELYAGYTDEQLDGVYAAINDTTSVIERPKMIYNEKTGMYVIWFHADGPTKTSDSNYAAACAGVAVSESPAGPFRFVDRYRLNTCPEDQEDFYPQSKGMARDMNLFVDDDGTAYIIYSSEENLTIYISRLNEEYTYLDVAPEEAVYGVDFVRLYPGAQREAPAVFKRNGIYYMMTSGATGWNPNQARYYMSDSMFGEWENLGDPCIGDVNKTTFASQSTCIFCADEEKDLYVYMGDRWNSDDLADSRYVWLPVDFDEEGHMSISWTDTWSLEEQ